MSLGVPRVASMTISFARPLFRLVTTRMYIYRWLAGYLILRVGFGFAAGSQPKRPGDPSEPSARRLRVASRARGPRAARPNPGARPPSRTAMVASEAASLFPGSRQSKPARRRREVDKTKL